MATRRTTKKNAPAKKQPTKHTAKKAKTNGESNAVKSAATDGELELVVKDDVLKTKMMASGLLFDREDGRVRAELQPKLNEMLAKAQRNSPGWKKAEKLRKDTINELIEKYTEDLPEGYCIRRVNLEEGTYTAVYSPKERGQLLK